MAFWRCNVSVPARKSCRFKTWVILLPFVASLSACQSYLRSVDFSPDGRFCVVVRSYPMLVAMPGQGSDAPGTVHLYTTTGQQLESASLEMVQQFEGLRWSATQVEVDIGLEVETWQLPSEDGSQPSSGASNACLQFKQEWESYQ